MPSTGRRRARVRWNVGSNGRVQIFTFVTTGANGDASPNDDANPNDANQPQPHRQYHPQPCQPYRQHPAFSTGFIVSMAPLNPGAAIIASALSKLSPRGPEIRAIARKNASSWCFKVLYYALFPFSNCHASVRSKLNRNARIPLGFRGWLRNAD
jgi:hypothetical protein